MLYHNYFTVSSIGSPTSIDGVLPSHSSLPLPPTPLSEPKELDKDQVLKTLISSTEGLTGSSFSQPFSDVNTNTQILQDSKRDIVFSNSNSSLPDSGKLGNKFGKDIPSDITKVEPMEMNSESVGIKQEPMDTTAVTQTDMVTTPTQQYSGMCQVTFM